MQTLDIILFLCLVGVGAMVQSITGFAMGLIIMAGVTALHVADIAFAAAVVSLISLVNASLALRHTYRFIDLAIWRRLLYGLLPATVFGVLLLTVLSAGFTDWLRILLGVVIVVAGILLMMQPKPWEAVSGTPSIVGIGGVAGVIGGLYGAGGAPLAWFMYRQPLELSVVRATLLATFLASTFGRTVVISIGGQMTVDILWMALLSLPVVVVVTLVSTRLALHVPDRAVRRVVFVILMLLGISLIVRG